MSHRDHEINKPLEAELLGSLRLMTPEARQELLQLAAAYTELFPLRPVLRLVETSSGGGK